MDISCCRSTCDCCVACTCLRAQVPLPAAVVGVHPWAPGDCMRIALLLLLPQQPQQQQQQQQQVQPMLLDDLSLCFGRGCGVRIAVRAVRLHSF
jgi:hypothetical protein